MYVKVAKRAGLKRAHHKKIMCSCEWWWMVTELLVIISQHVHISNHDTGHLKLHCSEPIISDTLCLSDQG